MALSKTQNGLALVAGGMSPRLAAKEAGIAVSTLRMAMGRIKGRDLCPCCGQVVREGFETIDLEQRGADAYRQWVITYLEQQAKKTEDSRGAAWMTAIANKLRPPE